MHCAVVWSGRHCEAPLGDGSHEIPRSYDTMTSANATCGDPSSVGGLQKCIHPLSASSREDEQPYAI